MLESLRSQNTNFRVRFRQTSYKDLVFWRGEFFTSRFWQKLQEATGTGLDSSTTFHPQTDGQSERMIQTLEDMLRMCVMDLGGSWNDHLPLVEFAYNNSYHSSIEMAPYEAFYARKYRSPLCWDENWEKRVDWT